MDFYYKTSINSIDYQIKLAHDNLVSRINYNHPIYGSNYLTDGDSFHTPLESQYDIYNVGLCAYKDSTIITPAIDLYIESYTLRRFKSFYDLLISIRPVIIGGKEKGDIISGKKKKYILKLGSIGEKSIKFAPTKLKRFL